jgi:hypothetical protein
MSKDEALDYVQNVQLDYKEKVKPLIKRKKR